MCDCVSHEHLSRLGGGEKNIFPLRNIGRNAAERAGGSESTVTLVLLRNVPKKSSIIPHSVEVENPCKSLLPTSQRPSAINCRLR